MQQHFSYKAEVPLEDITSYKNIYRAIEKQGYGTDDALLRGGFKSNPIAHVSF
ncbi:hypothetical protein GCM10020331_032200 [Ectobacillus funiculus]